MRARTLGAFLSRARFAAAAEVSVAVLAWCLSLTRLCKMHVLACLCVFLCLALCACQVRRKRRAAVRPDGVFARRDAAGLGGGAPVGRSVGEARGKNGTNRERERERHRKGYHGQGEEATAIFGPVCASNTRTPLNSSFPTGIPTHTNALTQTAHLLFVHLYCIRCGTPRARWPTCTRRKLGTWT